MIKNQNKVNKKGKPKMNQPKPKDSITIKPSQQTCTIKSILSPNLTHFDINQISIIWYRQPPVQYDIEELTHNFNQHIYKCSSLDYQCVILCKVFAEGGKEVARFQYGPVETFVYSRLSTSLELRVHVLLFGVWKKFVFALGAVPTLVNPQNKNKYQLTQQDIRSIFVKPSQSQSQQTSNNLSQTQGLSIVNTQLKKTIVIQNLFQRLILLKLFNEIPNGMYCHSTEVLQMNFYDEISCNVALLAINRFKYQKRDSSEVTKSMQGQSNQELTLTKMIKKSNDSFTQLKGEFTSNGPYKNLSEDTLKKEFLPLSAFTNWRKSPKQSINSANESSIISGNSSRANDSRASLIQKNLQVRRNIDENESKEGLTSKGSSEYRSRVSIKQPKISILSTDINSTKLRQQKPSFSQGPPVTQTLKSSELIIKPKQFKSSLSLRRSQQEIKTPRMDVDDDDVMGLNSAKFQGLIKKKSFSQIQVPNEKDEVQEKDQYVNEFENLLFQVGEDENNQAQFCLNDSFAKLEEEEEKDQLIIIHSPVKRISNKSSVTHIPQYIPPPSPKKSQRNMLSLKETLKSVLKQNYELKLKNEDLKKQISGTKQNGDKKNGIEKYEGEILRMREIQSQLVKEIEGFKKSVIMSNSQVVDRSRMQNSRINRTAVKQKMNYSFKRSEDISQQSSGQEKTSLKQQCSPNKRQEPYKYVGSLFFPPRQSMAGPQITFKSTQGSSPTFIIRKSQQHDPSKMVFRQVEQAHQQQSPKNIVINSEDLKFIKFQQDPQYQKQRNNQSYSYKQTDTMKMDERKYQPYKY